jgi:7,8-didemethyl-8-hydroxy-5-deazariboflavin synthase CofH subunit
MNFDTIANSALSGREISQEEGLQLLRSLGAEEREVFALARRLNEGLNGPKVTFVQNRNLNFTNICALKCRFCAFCRDEFHPQAFILTAENLLRKIQESPGITEVCIQGAIHPRLEIAYYLNLLRLIKEQHPRLHIHGISPQEVFSLSQKSGWSVERTIAVLREAGLDSMAGTAAEILVDRIRQKICPGKISSQQWVEIVKTAHRLGLKSTATILFGHLEGPEDVLEHLTLIREIQHETEGFTEFVPLLFIPYSTPLGNEYSLNATAPWNFIQKVYSLSRIFLFPAFKNIQTSWVKLGVERALDILDVGANDFGGTLFEENITRSAGGSSGEFLSVQEIQDNLIQRGKIPVERDTLYRAI